MTTITDNLAEHRFELATASEPAAVYYRLEGDTVVLTHTEVPYEHAGQGLGTALAKGVFELMRRSGTRVQVRCDFMGRFVAQHPEYADVLAR
jgi:uncharacterized protein